MQDFTGETKTELELELELGDWLSKIHRDLEFSPQIGTVEEGV